MLLTQCASFAPSRRCDDLSLEQVVALPPRLPATGLYARPGSDELAPNVEAYAPRFELWSDGAEKRRWIALPPGSAIDKSDPDAWQFPVGTKLWKELSFDGVRIETRFLTRIAANAWAAGAYVWPQGDGDAVLAISGLPRAHGKPHDVPAARQCAGCHAGTPSFVLGYSAIQLSQQPIPGDAESATVLGYLHVNCGHCHNQHRPQQVGARCYDPHNALDFSLRTNQLGALADTPLYRTALGRVIEPGRPDGSKLYRRLAGTAFLGAQMPPLGIVETDVGGAARVRAWIERLPKVAP